jgi:hypothetical protein
MPKIREMKNMSNKMHNFTIKFLAVSLIIMLFAMLTVSVTAGDYDSVLTGASFMTLSQYTGDEIGTYQQRGFTVSPDGAYIYGGFLQSDKRVYKFDPTGKILGEYKDAEPGYPKGLAADDRGYLYVGIANQANDGAVRYAIVSGADMKEVYITEIAIAGKVGVNGVAVREINGKYILYFVTNYGPNYIYSFDVTDVTNPVPNASFGNNGIVSLADLIGGTEGSYIAAASDGTLYLSYNTGAGSKGDTLFKIAPDGKSIVAKAEIAEAYGVSIIRDDYVLVSTYSEPKVYILNAGDLSVVGQIAELSDAACYSMAILGGDKIYISDGGYGGSGDRILVSNRLSLPDPVIEVIEETTPDETIATAETVAAGKVPAGNATTAAQTYDGFYLYIYAVALIGTALLIFFHNSAKSKRKYN